MSFSVDVLDATGSTVATTSFDLGDVSDTAFRLFTLVFTAPASDPTVKIRFRQNNGETGFSVDKVSICPNQVV